MRRLVLLAVCGLALAAPVQAQAATGTVEGTVAPVAWAQEIEVCVAQASTPTELCTVPASDGSYAFHGFPTGEKLEFVPTYRSRLLPQYYDHKSKFSEATAITVTEGGVAEEIDADLIEGGTIEGTASAAEGGAPLAEVEVCAISASSSTVKVCDQTDASGEYELHSLPTGSYGVDFHTAGLSAEYESWSHASVSVAVGVTTSGVDASLGKGAQIRGAVTAAAGGSPLDDVPVCLFGTGESLPQGCVFSDQDGEYAFEGLSDGSYQVGFSLEAAEGGIQADGFESQYYDEAETRAAAATIPVLAPSVIEGVDAALTVPAPPSSPAPVPSVISSTVAAAPTIAEPKPKKLVCKKPKRKQKVKGKVRCVKPTKKKTKPPKKQQHKKKTSHGKRGKK